MTTTVSIPCIPLDKISIPSIQFPAGAELKGMADFSAGVPSNCKMSLLVQLGPMLASISCLLKILQVLGNIVEFTKAVPDPMKMADKVGALWLNFEVAEGNPVLTEALEDARDNADTSMQNLATSMGPVMEEMNVVGSVASLAGLSIALPDLGQIGKDGDAPQAIASLKQSIDGLKSVIEALAGK